MRRIRVKGTWGGKQTTQRAVAKRTLREAVYTCNHCGNDEGTYHDYACDDFFPTEKQCNCCVRCRENCAQPF